MAKYQNKGSKTEELTNLTKERLLNIVNREITAI